MLGLDSDLGRHLVLGNIILDEYFVPTHDLLSHTRTGLSRPPYEWLSQVIFVLAIKVLELDGVILLTAFIIALTFLVLYQQTYRRSSSAILTSFVVLLAIGASSIHWLPRPHIFTFFFLAIWIDLLDLLSNDGPVNLYVFPLTMLVWVNFHGGFIFGILAWIAYIAGSLWERSRGRSHNLVWKKLLVVGILSVTASIITPDLWRNWDAVLNNRSVYILNRTVETMRPELTNASVLPYTFLLLLTLFVYVLNWKRFKPQHLFLLIGLGGMSLFMARNIPLFAIACTPIISETLAKHLSESKTWANIETRYAGFSSSTGLSAWPTIVTLSVCLCFLYINTIKKESLYHFNSGVFPVKAASFLEEYPQDGYVFNEFNWGGYLLYRLWPNQRVFIDSQTDFYGEALSREYVQVESLQPGWEEVLAKYKVDWAIIPTGQPLAIALCTDGWDIVYQDETAIVLVAPNE